MGHAATGGELAPSDHAGPSDTTMPSDDQARVAAATFAMLADPTRLKLLWLLGSEELDVGTVADRCRTTFPQASQHLAKLRLAGLVTQRVEGRRRYYSANGGHLRALIREALYRAHHDVTGIPDSD